MEYQWTEKTQSGKGATAYFEDQKLSVGLLNDDEFLYVALFAGDKRNQTKTAISSSKFPRMRRAEK